MTNHSIYQPSVNRREQLLCPSVFVDRDELRQFVPEIESNLGDFEVFIVFRTLGNSANDKVIFLRFVRDENNPRFAGFNVDPSDAPENIGIRVVEGPEFLTHCIEFIIQVFDTGSVVVNIASFPKHCDDEIDNGIKQLVREQRLECEMKEWSTHNL